MSGQQNTAASSASGLDASSAAVAAAAAAMAAAAAAGFHPAPFLPPTSLGSMLFYPTPHHYRFNLAAIQSSQSVAGTLGSDPAAVAAAAAGFALNTKNSSIADLRLKAKKYAAALGLWLSPSDDRERICTKFL